MRDLTGVSSLDPTREFPVDGAAGEGFINTGSAQAMSPAFFRKYLEAGKEVASHAVLLPDGVAFSAGHSRREWTDERLAAIQQFYAKFTVPTQALVQVSGTGKVANDGRAIPLKDYFAATLQERDALTKGQKTIEDVANEHSLNTKYLATLWRTLSAPSDDASSLLLDNLRKRWQLASPDDAPKLVAAVEQAQTRLWKFNSIGQLTSGGKQKVWMEPVAPVITQQEFRLPLPLRTNEKEFVVNLSASDLSDGRDQDFVVWKRPRLEFKPEKSGAAHPPILLRDVPSLVKQTQAMLARELPRTADYLNALTSSEPTETSLDVVAAKRDLDAKLLRRWSSIVGVGPDSRREIAGHYTTKMTRVQGYPEVNGWGKAQTPSLLTNRSREDISFLTLTVPARSVVVHPSPKLDSVVAWRSPIAGKLKVKGVVADADGKCGNGAAWRLEVSAAAGTSTLASGKIDNGRSAKFELEKELTLRRGDVVSLVVGARDNNHVCDTTHIALTLSETGGKGQRWDLAGDVVERVLEANPLSDSYGNAEVWHFCSATNQPQNSSEVIAGSALSRWRAAVVARQPTGVTQQLAESVQRVLTVDDVETLNEPDRRLREQPHAVDWSHAVGELGMVVESDGVNVSGAGTTRQFWQTSQRAHLGREQLYVCRLRNCCDFAFRRNSPPVLILLFRQQWTQWKEVLTLTCNCSQRRLLKQHRHCRSSSVRTPSRKSGSNQPYPTSAICFPRRSAIRGSYRWTRLSR